MGEAPVFTILLIPAPPKQSARDMRPLWRDLILQKWGGDPLQCPCCKGNMKPVSKVIRREEIEKRRRLVGVLDRNPAQRVTCPAGVKGRRAALNQFFLRLHGLWVCRS